MKLFDPVVPEDLQHHNFKNALAIGNGFNLDVVNDWARGFADRDGKFVKEFQTTFNSSFWELYLFAILKKFELRVDFSHNRPDFYLPDVGLNIEATVASHSVGTLPESARFEVDPPDDLNEFNHRTIIRISNSLISKHKQYMKSYSKLNHVSNRPFVLAVANFDQPSSFLTCQRPIEAVLHEYYVDEESYLAGARKGEVLSGETLSQVFKENGSPIELGIFNTDEYKEISAVIFNGCANWGKVRAISSDPNPNIFFTALRLNISSDLPHVVQCTKQHYSENLLDGLRVYHNPYAAHPVDPALFRHPSVFQSYMFDGSLVREQRDGQLLCRFVFTGLTDNPAA